MTAKKFVATPIFALMNTVVTKISFSFPKKRGDYLVFSLPQTNHYQNIINLAITPSGCKKTADKCWGNKIVILTLNDVKKEVKIDFQIKLKPYSVTINKNYKITNYSKNVFSPNRFINGQDQKIVKIAKGVVGKERNLETIIKNLYLFTRNYLTYGKPTAGLYSYKQAIEERMTDCGGFSTFLASLLQTVNIPSRLVVGFLIKKDWVSRILTFNFSLLTFNFLKIHVWLEVMLPNKSWFPIDASTSKFGQIPANRLVTSFGCDFNIKINNSNYQIDLLQKPVYLSKN